MSVFGFKAKVRRVVKALAADYLHQVVIPDPVDEEIELDYVVLSPEGAWVLDSRQTTGTVFASDDIDRWAVMGDQGRFSMSNPLYSLQARVIAVQALMPDVPVQGRVIFSDKAKFSHEQPKQALHLAELKAMSQGKLDNAQQKKIAAFMPSWDNLKNNAKKL